jgi:hypothetical protein
VCVCVCVSVCEGGVPGEILNLNYIGYSDHGRYGDLPLWGKIPTAEPGIEPGTSWLVEVLTTKPRGWSVFSLYNLEKCFDPVNGEALVPCFPTYFS